MRYITRQTYEAQFCVVVANLLYNTHAQNNVRLMQSSIFITYNLQHDNRR